MSTTAAPRVSAVQHACLDRSIGAFCGKGGTGKTSVVAHSAALFAAAGYRTLAVGLDPQGDGNLGGDLGYNALGLTDKGRSLAMALSFGQSVNVLRNVRDNLDVICDGKELEDAVSVLSPKGAEVYRFRLLEVLAPIADNYDFIFIDTPPGGRILQEMALTTCRYAIIPTRTDSVSIDEGVGHIATSFAAVKAQANPDLTLLGAIIFGTSFKGETTKTKQRKDGTGETIHVPATARFVRVRERIEAILGQVAPVFDQHVRYVEAAADDARDGGQLAHELEATVVSGPAWYQLLRNPELGGGGARLASASSAKGLAGDYQAIAEQLMGMIVADERRRNGDQDV